MRKVILIAAALGLTLAVGASPVSAADQSIDISGVASKIRNGKINVGREFSMDDKTGRMHKIHGEALGLKCEACHFGQTYQSDFLLVRKGEPATKEEKGLVDRTMCIACHGKGGPAQTFYGERAAK